MCLIEADTFGNTWKTRLASSSQVHVKQKGKGERGRVRVEGFVSEGQYAGRYKVVAS
jgi:hypothetical protein